MSERVTEATIRTATMMESLPAEHELSPYTVLAVSAYGVPVPEAGSIEIEADHERLQHGRPVASIDTANEDGQVLVQVYDVSATPWKENTGETGNFLAATYVVRNDGNNSPVPETERLHPGIATSPTKEVILGINQDGRLLIANRSAQPLLVRNLELDAKPFERPATNQAPVARKVAGPTGSIAAAEVVTLTGNGEEAQKPELPKRIPRDKNRPHVPIGKADQGAAKTSAEVPAKPAPPHPDFPRMGSRRWDRRTLLVSLSDIANAQESGGNTAPVDDDDRWANEP